MYCLEGKLQTELELASLMVKGPKDMHVRFYMLFLIFVLRDAPEMAASPH